MDHRAPSPLRYMAPLALAAATLVFLLVITGSLGGSDVGSNATDAGTQQAEDGGSDGSDGGPGPRTYEIQEGDTLDAIAAETGVSVEKLQRLNPDIDPQSLIAGQELKLRK